MKPLITIFSFVLVTCYATAQDQFTGTWKLKEKQNVSGPDYMNALPNAITIQPAKDSLVIETVSTDGDNKETTSRIATALNGSAVTYTSPTSGRKVARSLQWSNDKKTLTITSNISKEGDDNEIEITRVDVYTMDAQGNLNLQRKSIETVYESWEAKGVFVKQ